VQAEPARLTEPAPEPPAQQPATEPPVLTPAVRQSTTEPLAVTRTASPPPQAPDPPAVPAEPPAAACAVDHRYGTSVDFVDDPTAAAEKALKEKKLLFVLHVAGNFEKDRFT
jgi:hypothetical protein